MKLYFDQRPHPTMFALVVGVAIGTVLLPEIWGVTREHVFPVKPHPNMDMQEAIKYLRERSKWAIGRLYSKNENHLLEEDIDCVLRDAAAQGRITIWGRPKERGVLEIGERATEIAVPQDEWTSISFDLTTMVHNDAPRGVCARDRTFLEDRYYWLRVDRRELNREWPPALFARLALDKTWRSRKRMMVPNV